MSERPEESANPKPRVVAEPENLADREMRNPLFRWLIHLGFPLTASIVLHVFLIGITAFKVWEVQGRPEIDVGDYEAGLTESLADQMESAFEWPDQQELEAPEDVLDSLDELDDLRDVEEMDMSDFASDDNAGDFGLGEGEGGGIIGIGEGAGEAGSGGFGTGVSGRRGIGVASMWGTKILANRLVYVIDFSGSIIVSVGDLKRALKRSIGDLKPSQSFNVIIFYSTGTSRSHRFRTESYADSLQTANKNSKAAFFKWIDRKSPMGQTEPLPALRRALKQNAEAILFFSDGLFDDSVVTEVTRLNRAGRTKIYCFLFDEVALTETGNLPPRDTPGTPRLRKMVEQNGNTRLKIVTGNDLAGG